MSLRFRFDPRVGYITPANFRSGYTLFGPSFSDVGKQTEGSYTIDIQNIKPVGESIPNGSDTTVAISIQKLTPTGGMDGQMLFWTDCPRKKQGKNVDCLGWYPGTGTTQGSMTLSAGEALWVLYPETAACSLQISGEVPSGEVYKTLNKGYTAVANPLPVTVDIQKVLPAALDPADIPNGSDTTAAISIQKLTATGGMDGQMLFWTNCPRKKQGKNVDCLGWYPGTGTTQGTMTLAPGEGIWTLSPNDKCSLVFPSAFAKDEVTE